MNIKKRVLSIMLTVFVTIFFVMSSTTAVSAVVVHDTAESIRITAPVELTATGGPGTVDPMGIGPILESPGDVLCLSDIIPVTKSAIITLWIPKNTTLNKLYLVGSPSDGYITTAVAYGIGGVMHNAYVNGNWYRISDTNLGISGGSSGKLISVSVALVDSTRTYSILLAGTK